MSAVRSHKARAREMERLRDEEGYTLREIAAKFDLSAQRVGQIIGRGDAFAARRRLMAPVVVSLYENAKMPVTRIASELQISIPTASRILTEAGVEIEARPTPQIWTRARCLEAMQLWFDRYGQPPTARDWGKGRYQDPKFTDEFPYTSVVRRRFGSFNDAIRAAGWEPLARAHGRQTNRHKETALVQNGQ